MPANAPNYVDIADDGSIWAVTRNSDGQYSLCTGQDANALELVEVDSLLQSGALPVGLRLTDDGKVFLTVQVAESTIFVLIDCATRQVTTITPAFTAARSCIQRESLRFCYWQHEPDCL